MPDFGIWFPEQWEKCDAVLKDKLRDIHKEALAKKPKQTRSPQAVRNRHDGYASAFWFFPLLKEKQEDIKKCCRDAAQIEVLQAFIDGASTPRKRWSFRVPSKGGFQPADLRSPNFKSPSDGASGSEDFRHRRQRRNDRAPATNPIPTKGAVLPRALWPSPVWGNLRPR